MCNKLNFLYCFTHCRRLIFTSCCWSSKSLTGPSNSSTSMDTSGSIWVRQQPSGTCFSSKTPGPASASVLPERSPLQLFSQFFTDEVLDLLVVETNRYVTTVSGSSSHARPWTDVTVKEIKAFWGVILCMGITLQPCLELYWTTKYPLNIHGDTDVMPINRFQQLFRCFHLADNSVLIPHGQPGYDRLFMVRTLLDLFVQKFESESVIRQECTIDEAMIPFKGRLCFKHYLKDKPTQWGIKAG